MEQTKLSGCRDQQRLPIEVRAELVWQAWRSSGKNQDWIFPAVVPKPPPCPQEDRTHYHHLLVKGVEGWQALSPVPGLTPPVQPPWFSWTLSPQLWRSCMQTSNVFKPQTNKAPSCPHGICCWWATSLSHQRLWRTVPRSYATETVGDSSVKEVGREAGMWARVGGFREATEQMRIKKLQQVAMEGLSASDGKTKRSHSGLLIREIA